jgi:hypothetical protein
MRRRVETPITSWHKMVPQTINFQLRRMDGGLLSSANADRCHIHSLHARIIHCCRVRIPECHEQRYDPDTDELRQRGLVWEHDGINPKDFEYIKSCLKEAWNNRSTVPLDMIDDNDMFLQLKGLWKQETSYGLSDISADEFLFLQAADFLGIRGDACKHFT